MKRKLLKKLCIYAVSASMMLPVTVPVAAAKSPTTATSQSYAFNLVDSMNYSEVLLYTRDTLQLRSSYSKERINKVPGKLKWVSSNPQLVSVSSTGKITAKKESYRKPVTIYLIKGNTYISECKVYVDPPIQFLTKTRTAKKGTTLKIYAPDATVCFTSSNSKVVKAYGTIRCDNYGERYMQLNCINKGTATITVQMNEKFPHKNTDFYQSVKKFKFKINVK